MNAYHRGLGEYTTLLAESMHMQSTLIHPYPHIEHKEPAFSLYFSGFWLAYEGALFGSFGTQ